MILEEAEIQKLLKEAVRSLGVDRPILRVEVVKHGVLRLHILGGEVVEWSAGQQSRQSPHQEARQPTGKPAPRPFRKRSRKWRSHDNPG